MHVGGARASAGRVRSERRRDTLPLPSIGTPVATGHTSGPARTFTGLALVYGCRATAAGLALAVVACLFGAVFRLLDFINHFQALMALASLALLGAAWFVRDRDRDLMAVATVIASVHVLLFLAPAIRLPETLFGEPAGERVRLMTFNAFYYSQRTPELIAYIRRNQPDFVVLQEINGSRAEAVNAGLRDIYPHRLFCNDCDVGILSQRPWQASRQFARDAYDTPSAVVVSFALAGERQLHLASVHLMNPAGPFRQQRELDRLRSLLDGRNGPLILAGDLNLTPWSWAFNRFARDVGVRERPRLLGTWSASRLHLLPWFPIDHVLASPEIAILSSEAGPFLGSDHLPLLATLVLPTR